MAQSDAFMRTRPREQKLTLGWHRVAEPSINGYQRLRRRRRSSRHPSKLTHKVANQSRRRNQIECILGPLSGKFLKAGQDKQGSTRTALALPTTTLAQAVKLATRGLAARSTPHHG
jgi:hypothetical protein